MASFRAAILEVSKTRKPVTGIEVGRGGFVIRGIAPIMDNGEYLGSVEMFYDFKPEIQRATSEEGMDMALFMNEDLLNIASQLKDNRRIGPFVEAIASNENVSRRYSSENDINLGAGRIYHKRFPGMMAAFFPVKDYSGKQIGVIGRFQDASREIQLLSGITHNIMIGVVVMMILLMGVLYLFLNFFVIRPIARTAQAAEAIKLGKLDHKMEWNSGDEIGRLAESNNTMSVSLAGKCDLARKIVEGDLTIDVSLASDDDSLGKELRAMVESLNKVIGLVGDSADQVASGSREIVDASQALSLGATEQAASLEEISGSMTSIQEQTNINAENDGEANSLVMGVKEYAGRGDAMMRGLFRP